MRPSARILGIALGLLPLVSSASFAADYRLESPLSLILFASGSSSETQESTTGGGEFAEVRRLTFRVTNRDLLQILVDDDIIPDLRGWRVVALWANWPETGNGYRFFAQNLHAREDLRAIPEDLLQMEVMGGAVEVKHRLDESDTITGGSERFKMLARLTFSPTDAVAVFDGTLEGTGAYRRLPGTEDALYLPGGAALRGAGVLDRSDPEAQDLVLQGRLSLAPARPVRLPGDGDGFHGASFTSSSASFSATTYLPDPISLFGPSQLTVSSGGTLTLNTDTSFNDNLTVHLLPGATLNLDGTPVLIGSDFSLSFSELKALNPESLPPGYTLSPEGVLTYLPPAGSGDSADAP